MPFDQHLQQHLNRQTPAESERRAGNREPAHEGRVITYDAAKKYGFIAQARDGADIFVPERELRKAGIANITRGDRVLFDIVPDKRGRPIASNIKLAA